MKKKIISLIVILAICMVALIASILMNNQGAKINKQGRPLILPGRTQAQ